MTLAKNLCLKCKYEWEDRPGPHTKCPVCGHLYVKWLNYEEMFPERVRKK